MNITRKDVSLFLARLVPLVGVLFLFIDMMGILFVGDDYTISTWFRWKVVLFLIAFSCAFLIGSDILKWPVRQLGYIGYPLYLLIVALCGVFTAPHDLLGYKIGLAVIPFIAQILKWYGKGWLRRYLRMISLLSGGRIFNK